jgi:hypothetical protein
LTSHGKVYASIIVEAPVGPLRPADFDHGIARWSNRHAGRQSASAHAVLLARVVTGVTLAGNFGLSPKPLLGPQWQLTKTAMKNRNRTLFEEVQ